LRHNPPAVTASPQLRLSDAERAILEAYVRAGTTPQRLARRAHIVLLAAGGLSSEAIAERLGVTGHTARRWIARFSTGGVRSLEHDAPGRGRRPTATSVENVARVAGLIATPPADRERWTVRSVASAAGLSRASASRILRVIAPPLIPRQ
jgi:transposase